MSLLFFLALVVVGWLLFKVYLQNFLNQGKAGKIKLAMIVLGVVFLALAVTGRAPALFAILGAAMTQIVRLAPLLIRYAPSLRKFLGSAIPGAASVGAKPGVSQVSTTTIDMSLDHVSGQMDGDVKLGPCAGMKLSQLNLAQLQSVYAYCQQHDMDALKLVQTYAARTRADEWQEPDDQAQHSSNQSTQNQSSSMSVREACEVLGVTDSATKKEIVHAHRSLMSRLHPDKGGSNYLAAKVNAAKQCLLDAL